MKNLIFSILTFVFALGANAQCPPILDQFQWSIFSGSNDTDSWQSFTSNIAGDLSQINIMGNGGVNTTVTISIYEGQGVGGALMYSGSHSFNQSGAQPELVVTIPCDQMPTVVVGNEYTLRIQGSLSLIVNSSNPYPNGVFYRSASGVLAGWDMSFKTFVSNPNKPVNNLTAIDPTCSGDTDGQVTNIPSGGNAPYLIYNWSNGGTNSTENVGAGTYMATVTDASSCVSCPTDIVVSDPMLVTVSAGTDQTICEGQSAVMSASSPNATTFSWTPAGSLDNATLLNPTATPTTTTNYSITASDGNGCTATDDVTINVNPAPAVVAQASATNMCLGDQLTLFGQGANTYTWDLGVIDNTSFEPSVGVQTYTVTGTDLNNCTNTDQINVMVNALPIVTAPIDFTVCGNGSNVTLSGTGSAGNVYTWNNGVIDNTVFNPTLGAVNYTLTGTNSATGCSNTDDVIVDVIPKPTVTITADQDICDGDDITISASGAVSYVWDNGLGAGSSHLVTPLITTEYFVTSTGANSCTKADSVTITVNPIPTVNAGADITQCENEEVIFLATGANTYTWSSGATNGTGVLYTPGIYNFTVTGADANGCEDTDDFTFTINGAPVLITSDDQYFCKDDVISLNVSGATTYDWENGAATTSTYELQPISSTSVVVIGESNGCETEKIIELFYDDPVNISAGDDQEICPDFIASLSATGGNTYVWNGPNVENMTSQSIDVTPEFSDYYHVTVSTDYCEYKDSVFVDIKIDPSCGIENSNTISPNGDGVNDEWVIDGIAAFPENSVLIYNRWGDIVFEAQNYDNVNVKWVGEQLNGDDAISGTYFYQINLTDGPSYSGWIELMR